jgi:signal transduction histidine kinase
VVERADRAPGTPRDILVVDDDPRNLIAIEAALGDLGRRLVKVTSGADALATLLACDVALILLDVKMPSMDGLETARLIRQRARHKHVPIIFITAYDRSEDRVHQAYQLGAVDFLFKPIAPEVLRAKVAVFVALQERTAQVMHQADLLREAERREHEQRLEEARHGWEAEMLRRQVAEQRRAAAELTHVNSELTEAHRHKDEFLAMLAHELRNPLTPLHTDIELLRAGRDTEHVCGRMRRHLQHLTRLVDDLLDISRISTGAIELRKEPMRLDDAIEQAVAACRPLIQGRGQSLQVELPEAPPVASLDPARISQVLTNLLHNAAKHGREGGFIRLTASEREGALVLEIADDGEGVPEALRERIFEPFVQGRRSSSGLGVGLALVKRLVELHGGSVAHQHRKQGPGSVFRVCLPIDGSPSTTAWQPRERPSSRCRSLRIVLMEDAAEVREALGEMLELWGHQVALAPDGVAGIEKMMEHRAEVAIVDIGMPDVDGYEVARRLRSSRLSPRPRLIALTGYGNQDDLVRARAAGFDAHVTKPPDLDLLQQLLAEADTEDADDRRRRPSSERAVAQPECSAVQSEAVQSEAAQSPPPKSS